MLRKSSVLLLGAALSAASLRADFSYEQESKITGGAIAGMMKIAGAFSKQVREPIRVTVAVKGDRMTHWSPQHAYVIDLSSETITQVNNQRKEYSVMTFAEMAKMMEEAAEKMKSGQKENKTEMNVKAAIKETGQTKTIAGFDTREVVMTIEMEGTDPQSGQTGAMTVTTDMWIAPKVAGYEEVRNFQQKMGQKLAWSPGSPMMGRSDIAKAMAGLAKEAAKLDGMPVYEVIKMGAAGNAPAGESAPRPQPSVERPSLGGALGGALGGRLGGFGRKKKSSSSEESAPNPSEAAPAQDASGALMEMTVEMSGFSSASVDASKFEVPAGFKKVEADRARRGRQ